MMLLNQLSSWLTMGALDGIADAFTWGGIWLASGMYKVAMGIFQLFLILTTGKIINPSDLEIMISNFYIVIGVVMLFIIAFFLLKSMINPDDQSKSTSSIKKIIINLISSIIILAVLPTIFSFMFDVQDSVVNWNVFGKFFGYGDLNENIVEGNSYEMVKKQSYRLVNGVFTAFFNVDSSVNITSNDDLEAEQQKVKPNEKNIEVNTDKGSKPINSLESAIDYVNDTGKVSVYYNFSKAASGHEDYEGVKIDFDFLMCLIAGFIICYVGVSYCFDMAVRLIKLVFYQLIAPIPILLRIVPEGKLNGIFGQWLKVTITCYLEVFIRLFIFYFVVFMADRMTQPGTFLGEKVYEYGLLLSLLARAFTFLGLMMFMKQAPKLISEVTGFDSGNMKLGIREKLAESGAFTMGALAGGAITSGVRNIVNAGQNVKSKFAQDSEGKWHKKEGVKNWDVIKSVAHGAGSFVAGTVSGGVRSGYSAKSAKSFADMKSGASSGASAAEKAREDRAAYKASHGDTVVGAITGHVSDTGQKIKTWAGVGTGDSTLSYFVTAAQTTDSYNSMSEGTYKKKQEYVDQSSIVKALDSKYNTKVKEFEANKEELDKKRKELEATDITNTAKRAELDIAIREAETKQSSLETELQTLGQERDLEKSVLDQMQIDLSIKKRDIISVAATRLSVDQKTKYSNNEEFKKAYETALMNGFGITRNIGFEEIEWVNPETNQTEKVKARKYIYTDKDGKEIEKILSAEETKIYEAMLEGQAIDERWINKQNIAKLQKALDEANIGRQHIKTLKEREHIVSTGNRSTDKKDK